MLQNAYLVAKIGADTAENEQHFAEILPVGGRRDDPAAALAEDDVRLPAGAQAAAVPPVRGEWLLRSEVNNFEK